MKIRLTWKRVIAILHRVWQIRRKMEETMKKYVCKICGYVYDPAENNNVPFEELPEDWTCPICGVGKDQFEEA